jgi:ubiquinone/menaquinone biosynthesis C-methylase UbiE
MNPKHIIDMASAFYESCILFTASDLGIFDSIKKSGGATVELIASGCGLDLRGASLLLDGCAALGLLAKEGDTYTNTPESALFLTSDSPAYLGDAIRYNRDVYQAWGKLPQLARTGAPVEEPEIHLGDDPERTRTFVLSMHGRAMGIGRAVVPLVKLEGCKNLLDVGGGPGTYSVLLAQANPELNCTVIDLPGVTAVANELIAQQNMSERVKTIPGSYHETTFPAGQDAIIFFGVLHQESPEDICKLFHKAYQALNPGGKIFVLDMMTDRSHTKPVFSALFAVNMALTTRNGWVFSDHELDSWLESCGFDNFNCQPLPGAMPHWLASATKVSTNQV